MHLKIHKTLKASVGEVGKWAVANENESIRMRKWNGKFSPSYVQENWKDLILKYVFILH